MRTQRYLFFVLFILNHWLTPTIAQTTNDSLLNFIDLGMQSSVRFRPKDSIGAIGLPYKYTSPCLANSEMFTELYYWDAFFVNRYYLIPKACTHPTIRSYHTNFDSTKIYDDSNEAFDATNPDFEIALSNVNNLLYLVNRYGFVPNANRFSMLNRSQLPLLSEMVYDISLNYGDANWLKDAVSQLEKEYNFWMLHRSVQVKLGGNNYVLNRFGNQANSGQLNGFYQFLKHRLKTENQGSFSGVADSLQFAAQLLSEAESGWDFTPRFQGKCMDYLPVDLNAVLCRMEHNMVYFYTILIDIEEDPYTRALYQNRIRFYKNAIKNREKAMNLCMWDGKCKLYVDYNWKTKSQSKILTAASLWPGYLHVGKQPVKQSYETIKDQLIVEGLVMPIAQKNLVVMPYVCQWDSPNVWAPLQILGYEMLYKSNEPVMMGLAADICSSWLKLITEDWRKSKILKEKYAVILTNEFATSAANTSTTTASTTTTSASPSSASPSSASANSANTNTITINTTTSATVPLQGIPSAASKETSSKNKSPKQEGYGNPPMMGWTAAATYLFINRP